MTGLAFICGIVVLFIGVLAYETEDGALRLKDSQRGLWTWLTSDNWPAKVGAALMVLGIGALLRYVLLHSDVPPDVKLSAGVVMAALFGFASSRLHGQAARRGLHLALAGAAAGVAYLTAYSAFALFGYLDNIAGLTLLVLVSVAMAVFALSAEAASMAVLGMLGAYAAPAFGINDPGPLVVGGYYFVLSVLVLLMVLARGWRVLIHLSFLFTLAGALFFGWSNQYYRPENHAVMQPLIYLLVGLHIAMPIIERRRVIFSGGGDDPSWLERIDQGYFVALPLVAVLLTYCIAPQVSPQAALGTAGLAALWSVAGAVVWVNRREATRYGIVALLLAAAALLAWFDEVPGTLIALFMMAVLLTMAVRLPLTEAVENFASFMVTLLAALYVVQSMFDHGSGAILLNGWFGQRVVAVAIIAWCAWLRSRHAPNYGQLLYVIAGVLLCESIIIELLRWHLRITAEFVHVLAAAAIAAAAWRSERFAGASRVAGAATLVLWLSAAWAAANTAAHMPLLGLGLIAIDVAVLGYSAQRFAGGSHEQDGTAMTLLFAMPLLAASWNIGFHPLVDDSAGFRLLCVTTLAGLAMALFAQRLAWLDQRWSRQALPAIFWFDAYLLGALTLCYIARGAWPVAYEWSGLALLALLCWLQRDAPGAERRAVATLVAGALVVQAQLLRVLTPELQPDWVMSVMDVAAMTLPAVLSLIWAVLGAALAYWSSRAGQRGAWTAGTGLMAVAAGKLVLVDFGSLGDLGNILALIAAGAVFMGVAWAVPMPPRAAPVSPPSPPTPDRAWGEAPSETWRAAPEAPAAKPAAAPLEFGTFNLRPRVSEPPPRDTMGEGSSDPA
ncbi:MAG: DUF2339 domain-containing protein [Gammaproteobacteria bacterium]|nr:DUF2339 domain-containing protein [Gammaproteobacteria bacterium]